MKIKDANAKYVEFEDVLYIRMNAYLWLLFDEESKTAKAIIGELRDKLELAYEKVT